MDNTIRPVIRSKEQVDTLRLHEIKEGIKDCLNNNFAISKAWAKEYNKLIEKLRNGK